MGRVVAAAQTGDRHALHLLYEEYSSPVLGYVRSIVADEHEAEDVMQSVFAKLMIVLPQYEERAVPFSAWILRVARNVALDHVRRRRVIPCEEVRGADARADDTERDRLRSLAEALASLVEDQREVVVLRHLVGLSPGEIAERLGRTEGSIHALHHRGRRALQAALEGLDAAPAVNGSRVRRRREGDRGIGDGRRRPAAVTALRAA